MNHNNISIAISKWQEILTSPNILIKADNLAYYQTSTLGENYHVPCVLMPNSIEELSRCLAIANQYNIKIFPQSTGQNHGYNSATPMADNTVVLNLSRMNKIIEFNQEFGYVIIEPGVRFEDLYKFLAQNDSNYMVSGFGGSSKASIVGNALDRGVGKGIYGNREKSSEIKEIVLADGTIVDLRNQMAYQDITSDFQHSIVGLDLGNLFYQSNLGVVSKMIIHLEPIPEHMLVMAFSLKDEKKLANLIEKLKLLNRKKVIEPVYSIYNDTRLVIGSGIHKKSVSNHDTLSTAIHDLSKKYGRDLGKWNSSFAINCSCKEDAVLRQKLIEIELHDIIDGVWFYDIDHNTAKNIIKKSLQNDFAVNESDFKFLFNLGYTNDYDQQTLYWCAKKQFQHRNSPVEDGCGLIFFAPKIPFNPKHIVHSIELITKTSEKYQMETPITFQFKSAEIAYMVIPIIFNLHNNKSKEQAHKYYKELLQIFIKEGYLPYRVNTLSMRELFSKSDNLNNLITKIKNTFDPQNIISPNKYMNYTG